MTTISAIAVSIGIAILFIMPITSATIGIVLMLIAGGTSTGIIAFALTADKEISLVCALIVSGLLLLYTHNIIINIWNDGTPFAPFSDWNNYE